MGEMRGNHLSWFGYDQRRLVSVINTLMVPRDVKNSMIHDLASYTVLSNAL